MAASSERLNLGIWWIVWPEIVYNLTTQDFVQYKVRNRNTLLNLKMIFLNFPHDKCYVLFWGFLCAYVIVWIYVLGLNDVLNNI